MAQIRNGQIETHIADIDHFVTGKVHLSAGSITKADVFLCATGRKFKPRMSSAGVSEDELGLPSNEVSATGMEQKADEGIYTRYPMLQSPPEGNPNNHELNGIPTQPAQPLQTIPVYGAPKLANHAQHCLYRSLA